MADILDTTYEGKTVELKDNKISVGDDVDLTSKDPSLRHIMIGMGWDANSFSSDPPDLDVSLFLLNKEDTTLKNEDFVFYNNEEACDEGIVHHGDSRTGAGEGDDENISIDLQSIPYDIMRIAVVLTIYQGRERGQRLSSVRNAYLRIFNKENHHEFLRYELKGSMQDREETGMIVGYIDRDGPKWHFRALAEFYLDGLGEIATKYGIIVGQQ